MKYRKKPIIIEAVKFEIGMNLDDQPEWLHQAFDEGTVVDNKNFTLSINTLGGTMTAQDGDYIIKGVNGELYPCKPDIFEKTYEDIRKYCCELARD